MDEARRSRGRNLDQLPRRAYPGLGMALGIGVGSATGIELNDLPPALLLGLVVGALLGLAWARWAPRSP